VNSARADTPKAIVAARLRAQAEWATKLGSPLYAELLSRSAADVEVGGPAWEVLQGHENDRDGLALGLRFMGAVHRLTLQGRLPELAQCYPSCGGRFDTPASVWPAFREALAQNIHALRPLVDSPVQTNEVRRCAALIGGFMLVAGEYGLPLRLLELGASAGLNLRFDHYRYEWTGGAWGNSVSQVRFSDVFTGAAPPAHALIRVAERSGCDQRPIDPSTPEGKLTLEAYIWADQARRFEQMRAAITIASRVSVQLDKADAGQWLPRRLATLPAGVATVVFHSVVWQYLEPATRERLLQALEESGQRASRESPLAWLRMEPAGEMADVRLKTWPGGEDRLLARAGYHGAPVQWSVS
jgi:hypothetical protein